MSIYYVSGVPYSDELYHHGIKGQKWGIRRYQNLDGTLTEEGKKKYGSRIQDVKPIKLRRQLYMNMFKSLEPGSNTDRFLSRYSKERKEAYKKADKIVDISDKRRFLKLFGSKFEDDFTRALMKDMGYEDTETGVKWLKQQKWFVNDYLVRNLGPQNYFDATYDYD